MTDQPPTPDPEAIKRTIAMGLLGALRDGHAP